MGKGKGGDQLRLRSLERRPWNTMGRKNKMGGAQRWGESEWITKGIGRTGEGINGTRSHKNHIGQKVVAIKMEKSYYQGNQDATRI